MNYSNKGFKIFLPIIFALLLISGIIIGNKLFFYNFNKSRNSNTDKLLTILNFIQQEYVDSISVNELTEKTIREILSNLDPHSVYIPAKELAKFNEPLEGEYGGVGIQYSIQNDTILIVNTINGGPSEISGIKAGDKIIQINDTLVAGKNITQSDVMKKLKGKSGTKVKVSVIRNNFNKEYNYTITRSNIPLHTIDVSYMISKSIGYIKVNSFGKTTHDEFVKAVTKLHKEGMNKVIIDLRENGGGYLNATYDLADEFLENGKLIVFTKGKSRQRKDYIATSKGNCEKDELIVLIDEGSASASEIFAGAIQDNDRGLIIGRRSYGKGLVQEPTLFSDGSSLNLTVARYYTPTGRCIQKPYNKGNINYYMDIKNRYALGELINKDSIHISNSLKYKTPKGRIVYGGGGIMPDVFIPYDTNNITNYYSNIIENELIYQYAIMFSNRNRNDLIKCKTTNEIIQYITKHNVFDMFIKYVESKGIKPVNKEISISKQLINTQLTALIIRNIQKDEEGFYKTIQQIDNTLLKAVDILDKKGGG